jgi:hypothetical protein
MRDGYVVWRGPEGFPAMPLGKRSAGIMSGTLAMSARYGLPLRKHTRIGICGWRTYDVPNTIQL